MKVVDFVETDRALAFWVVDSQIFCSHIAAFCV